MIYLIKSGNYFKIGYSENVEQRIKAYSTFNPDIEILAIEEGTKNDEARLHTICEELHYRNEWFHYNEHIMTLWNTYFKAKQLLGVKIPKNETEVTEDTNCLKILHKNFSNKEWKTFIDYVFANYEISQGWKDVLENLKQEDRIVNIYVNSKPLENLD